MPQFLILIIFGIISVIFGNQGRYRSRGFRLGAYYNDNDFSVVRWITNYTNKRNNRINALKNAASFIKPYEKIFGDHVISNKHCAVSLNAKRKQITCLSNEYNENGKKMILFADRFTSIDIDEYFDMICGIFSYGTTYKDIYTSLQTVAILNESIYSSRPVPAENTNKVQEFYAEKEYKKTNTNQTASKTEVVDIKTGKEIDKTESLNDLDALTDKTDVNSASEAELTALPGINVIVAKKIINYRETHRPFKSVEDFIEVMQIKPHFVKKLQTQICANKINMKKCQKAKSERIIDL